MSRIVYTREPIDDPLMIVVQQGFEKMDEVNHAGPEHDGSACPICIENGVHLFGSEHEPEPRYEEEA